MLNLRRMRRCQDDDTDLNMVPIMNMFLVLIPFLLMSASFFHIKAINTSIPVLAEQENTEQKQKEYKLTVVVELKGEMMRLSALCSELSQKDLLRWDVNLPMKDDQKNSLQALALYLKEMKKLYPASDTLILVPEDSVSYDTIIQTMDIARQVEDELLFPNVVLSGSIG